MGILKSEKLKGFRVSIVVALAVILLIAISTLPVYATSGQFSEVGYDGESPSVGLLVEYKEEKIEEIPYKTLYQYSSELASGEVVVSVEGETGTKKVTGTVVTDGGRIVERKETSTTIIKEAIDEIILVGSLSSLPAMNYTFEEGIPVIGVTYDKSVYVSIPEESKGSKSGREIVEFAMQYLGSPYVWGGTSLTNGCDCSGFVYSVFNACGYEMPRNNMEYVYPISMDEMLPGDIIAYPGHYAIYIGGGMEIGALNSRDGVCIIPVGGVNGYYNAVRVVDNSVED